MVSKDYMSALFSWFPELCFSLNAMDASPPLGVASSPLVKKVTITV